MTPNLDIIQNHSVGKRVAANTGLLVGAKAVAAIVGLGSLVITTNLLPIQDVGIILFLHAYMLFFAEVATFQSWQAVIRFGAGLVDRKDVSGLSRLLRFCIALDFVGALVAFVLAVAGLFALSALLPYLSAFQDQDISNSIDKIFGYGLIYCTLILIHQGGASTGIFRLFDRFKPLAYQELVRPVGRLLGVIWAATTHAGLEGYLAAWYVGSFLGYLALPLLALWELKSRFLLKPVFSKMPSLRLDASQGAGDTSDTDMQTRIWPFVWKANIDASLAVGTTHLPVLLIMPLFGPIFVSAYKIADEIARLLSEGVLLLDRVIYPEYARMIGRGDHQHIWGLVLKTASMLLAVGLLLSGFVALAGPWLIPTIFGAGYEDAVILSILLVLAAALMGVAAPLYPVFYATGRPEQAILARGLGMVLYIAVMFSCKNMLGKATPGWALIFGNLCAVLLAVWLAKRALRQVGPVRLTKDGNN